METPRPGDLWVRTIEYGELFPERTVFVLVTGSAVYQNVSCPDLMHIPVLISSHTSLKDGTILESRPPIPAKLYVCDFKDLELLSRSDKESEEDRAGEDSGWIFEFDGVRCVKVRLSVVE